MNLSLGASRRVLVALVLSVAVTGCSGERHTTASGAPALPPIPGAPSASFDAGALHVDRYGDGGDPIVLLPGLGAGPWEWYGVVAHLAPTHRVYTIAYPGFDGRPPRQPAPASVFDETAAGLRTLIDHEHLRHPVLIGTDLGGAIALAVAEHDPHVPRAVVAVDALPVPLTVAYMAEGERTTQADSAAVSFTRDPTMIRQIARQNVATQGAVDDATTDAILDRQAGADTTTLALDMRESLATDLRPDLGKIVAPLLVMVPYYLPDDSTPPGITPPIVHTQAQKIADYRALYAGATTATFVAIDPARHFPMLDAPVAFDRELDAFLARHP